MDTSETNQNPSELKNSTYSVDSPRCVSKFRDPASQCLCPSTVIAVSSDTKYFQCPVCLFKFDVESRFPVGLRCGHTMCLNCTRLIIPTSCQKTSDSDPTPINDLDLTIGLPNVGLLSYLEQSIDLNGFVKIRAHECANTLKKLIEIANLLKSHPVSRPIHRKFKLLKCAKALGERILGELTTCCNNLSHYHAQQQLWMAIRARACQFMGVGLQEEALKLVLLALEDGSALSRKVLVMFVVQRLAPQFPQASKTSVGHIVQLLYRASTFEVLKRPGGSSLMTLRTEYRTYEALRREHDSQIMKIGLEAGIRFTPEQWSNILYGDGSHKPLMQSILDKLQSPQTFSDLLKEFLVCIQRLEGPQSQALLDIYPKFQFLSAIEVPARGTTHPINSNWDQVEVALENVCCVFIGFIGFEKPTTRRKMENSRRQESGTMQVERLSIGGQK